ncbi:unnamed protein product [Amoebophrya sp. A120]|nr:unnamed protein product [Amoebophrya sp. A120]|eukprot:GSA120T00018147001.1
MESPGRTLGPDVPASGDCVGRSRYIDLDRRCLWRQRRPLFRGSAVGSGPKYELASVLVYQNGRCFCAKPWREGTAVIDDGRLALKRPRRLAGRRLGLDRWPSAAAFRPILWRVVPAFHPLRGWGRAWCPFPCRSSRAPPY